MNCPVNLLPWEVQRDQLLRRQVIRWSGVLILLVCFMAAFWYQKQRAVQRFREDLQAMNSRATPLRNLDSRNKLQQTELDSLIRREKLLNQIGAPFGPLQLINVLGTRSRVRDGEIRILKLDLATLEIQAAGATRNPAQARPNRRQKPVLVVVEKVEKPEVKTEVSLYGLARDDHALSDFVTSLRHTGVFESIELKSTDEVTHPSGLTREYRVRGIL